MWAQNLSYDGLESIELIVEPQPADKRYGYLEPDRFGEVITLLSQSRGRYVSNPDEITGQVITLKITQDGEVHTVANLANTYLSIDGDYYDAGYDWLSGWDELLKAYDAAPKQNTGSQNQGIGGASVDVPLSVQNAESYISQVLGSLVITSDGYVTFKLPDYIPKSDDGATELTITLNATFTSEPSTYSVQNLLDSETDWQGGDVYRGRLEAERGELTDVMLRVAFMTRIDENTYREYCADFIELSAPFSYDLSSGYHKPSVDIDQNGGLASLTYTLKEGGRFSVELTVPDDMLLSQTEESGCLLSRDGAAVGSINIYKFAATDSYALSDVDASADDLPMQIFSTVALSNHAGYENYSVRKSSETGACATAQFVWQDLSSSPNAASASWQQCDCILAYDWSVAFYFVEIKLNPEVLSHDELEALCDKIILSAAD